VVDDGVVAGWPPPDVKRSPRQVVLLIGLAVTLLVGGLLAYGLAAGEPVINDPVAVFVENGGTAVDVALTSCRSFEVTDVQIIAVANADALSPGPEEPLWDLHPTDPNERIFHLSASTPAAAPIQNLGVIPAADTLYAVVHYAQATAPKGFTNRASLSKPVDRATSNSDRQKYGRAISQKC
jgi:hypothetical protein